VVCVILDINLSDGSGIELRHRLNDIGVFVPVIYMTGNDDPAVHKAALDSGCIAFLTKPFPVQSLIEPLKKVSAGR
jgi:FixJ family two-component response regulator